MLASPGSSWVGRYNFSFIKYFSKHFITAEWFPPDLKSVVSSSLITFQFFMIFVAVQTTGPIINLVGNSGLFIYFCTICALKTLTVVMLVPETHGRTFAARNKGVEV